MNSQEKSRKYSLETNIEFPVPENNIARKKNILCKLVAKSI